MSEKNAVESTEPTYGSSLRKAEPFGTEEIPDSERHGHPKHQFTLWFAANMVLAVMVSGFFSSLFGLSVWQGLSAVAVGSLLGAVVMGVLAGIGTKLGVPQQVQGRGPMGYFGNYLPILLLTIVSAMGWTAVNTVFAVLAVQTMFAVPFWVVAGAIYIVQMLFAIWGHNLIHMINRVATIVLSVLFVVITILSFQQVDFTTQMNTEAPYYVGGFAGWVTFAGFFFAYVMTWTPFASDFSRYLPRSTSHVKVMGFTTAGNFIAMMWLGGIGVLVSTFAGELGAVEALAAIAGPWAPIAMWTIVLSTLPVSAMNLYGGAISILTLRIPVTRVVGVVISAIISFGIVMLMQTNPYGSFYDFLLVLAYLVVPFSTILLLDYYLRMRPMGRIAIDQLFDNKRRFEWGFLAWIIACVASSFFWNSTLYTGPLTTLTSSFGDIAYIVGIVVAAAAYLLLRLLPSSSKLN